MAIAQMNWGRMLAPLDDPRMADFTDALARIYRLAEQHSGFIWRIPDAEAEAQLAALGFDELMSATVSVWHSVDDLRRFTYDTAHAEMLRRRDEWFAIVEGPQHVIWDVSEKARPTFAAAFERLDRLKAHGPHAGAYDFPAG